MPTLLEFQRDMREQLFGERLTSGDVETPGEVDVALRLGIYRSTGLGSLVNALRLSFPAVQRLVGAEFFEGAAREFMRDHLPASAYLNEYGANFSRFLAAFAPAANLPYLSDVAQLEWAVNRALHASDVAGLDLTRLAALGDAALPGVRFTPHPALSLLRLAFPADAIWRAVLDQDDAAMAAIDLARGPVWLLIERDASGVQVRQLREAAWCLTERLCAGWPLHATLSAEPIEEIDALLADHLSSGRFIDFNMTDTHGTAQASGDSRT